jgi:site-specific DNA-methyltransferase (adenine-specific)
MPANCVDAIVTDPPFFSITHYQSTTNKQKSWADMSLLTHGWAVICVEARRILKRSGHMAVFCNASSYPLFFGPMYDRWQKLGCLVWDKLSPGLGHVWRRQHELVIIARDPGAWEPRDGRLRPDVLRHRITPSKRRIHPIHKPAALLAEIVEATCPPDRITLDPFAGSGTTGEACLRTGRRFIGCELNPAYAESARRWCRQVAADTRRARPQANPGRKPPPARPRRRA